MLDKQRIYDLLKKHKPALKERYPIERIGLFGSYLYNQQREDSDIDLIIDFAHPIDWAIFDLQEDLEGIFHKKVDITTSRSLKPLIRDEILKNAWFD